MFAQGKAQRVQSSGNGLLSNPSPGMSPTLPSPPGPAKVSEATSLWAAWICHPFLGLAPQLGWMELSEVDISSPQGKGGGDYHQPPPPTV